MDRLAEIQLHRRQQRPRRAAARRPDRGGEFGAQARGPHARDLRPRTAARRAIGRCAISWSESSSATPASTCTADDILVTSGSLQALDLVNGVLLAPRRHRHHRAGLLPGLDQPLTRLGVTPVGIPLDRDGMRMDALANALDDLKRRGVRPEIHLHHPDRAEPDRHHPAGSAPRRDAAARRGARRADLRGRLLLRPDLGRQAAARDLRHEQAAATSSTSARSRSRSRRRCASATSSRPGSMLSRMLRSRPTPAPARSSRWCSPNTARRISPSTCRC